jgi:hypothetical protein
MHCDILILVYYLGDDKMIAFSKMWDDVFKMVEENGCNGVKIVEKFKSGYIVLIEDSKEFITKEDFVNFWCRLLYYNEVETDNIKKCGEKAEYVYKFIKNLPYVSENSGIIKLVE